MNTNTLFAFFWGCLTIVLTTLILTCGYNYRITYLAVVNAGLCEVQNVGSATTHWTRCE